MGNEIFADNLPSKTSYCLSHPCCRTLVIEETCHFDVGRDDSARRLWVWCSLGDAELHAGTFGEPPVQGWLGGAAFLRMSRAAASAAKSSRSIEAGTSTQNENFSFDRARPFSFFQKENGGAFRAAKGRPNVPAPARCTGQRRADDIRPYGPPAGTKKRPVPNGTGRWFRSCLTATN